MSGDQNFKVALFKYPISYILETQGLLMPYDGEQITKVSRFYTFKFGLKMIL